jgi:hypothetical protein
MTVFTRRTMLLALVVLVALGLAAATWAASATPPAGSLTRLGGPGACLGPGHGCGRLRGPTGLLRLAISPDGRTLYASGQAGGLAVLARDPVSGRVHELSGANGCIRRDGRQGCARLRGLIDPGAIAVSPDGHSLYVTTSSGIEAFARTPGTGALRPIGCLDSGAAPGCARLRAPAGPSELLAAGNRSVYVTGTITDAQGSPTGALALLTRDPRSGALHQSAAASGCLDGDGTHNCAVAPCIDEITKLALGRNATRVYAGATNSLDPQATLPGDVATFARNPATGGLRWLGCRTRRAAISDLRPLPHSGDVLVSALYGNRGLGRAGGSLDLYRPRSGGILTRVRQLACIAHAPCPIPYYTDPARLAVAPNGDTVYVGMIFAGLTVLRHTAHGVSDLPGRAGCIVSVTHFMAPRGCAREGAEVGADLVLSPDGHDLYVGTLGPSHTQYYQGGVETFTVTR